jgi:hypothetical protein
MTERRALTRTVKVGETITFDDGRIVIQLLERTGRNASRIRFDLAHDVIVNKPGYSAAQFARKGVEVEPA